MLAGSGKRLQSKRPGQIPSGSKSRTASADYQYPTCSQQVSLLSVSFEIYIFVIKSLHTCKQLEHQVDGCVCVGWTLQCGAWCRRVSCHWWGRMATFTGGTSQKNNERGQCNKKCESYTWVIIYGSCHDQLFKVRCSSDFLDMIYRFSRRRTQSSRQRPKPQRSVSISKADGVPWKMHRSDTLTWL